MTTDELVAQVYTDWGETSTNSIISQAQITSWLNRGQRDLCLGGQVLLTCAKTSTVAGQESYNVPSDYLKAEAVFLLDGTPATRLYPMNMGMRDPTEMRGSPTRYYIWGENQASYNVYVIGLNPVPSWSGSQNLEIFYRQLPQKMVHSSEGTMVNPEVIQPWQDAMVDYALMCIYRRLGPDFQSLYRDHLASWKNWRMEAAAYVNPMTWDFPISRQDTANVTWDYSND